MIRHPRLAACAATAALAGAALLGPVAGAGARNTNTILGGATATQSQKIQLTSASESAIKQDILAYSASGTGSKGLGPLLEELSQVQGIKGTQFGDDLSTLATDLSNESGTSWQNFVAGANKLQSESGEFPSPVSTLFSNLSDGLLKLYNN